MPTNSRDCCKYNCSNWKWQQMIDMLVRCGVMSVTVSDQSYLLLVVQVQKWEFLGWLYLYNGGKKVIQGLFIY